MPGLWQMPAHAGDTANRSTPLVLHIFNIKTAHSQSLQGKYRNWCEKAGFESKLAGDVAAQKLKAERSQSTIDGHLVEKKLAERHVAYSDKIFRQAAIEWLVATDQVRLI
jgi:hypothetical protein